jgi:hypothetical protein
LLHGRRLFTTMDGASTLCLHPWVTVTATIGGKFSRLLVPLENTPRAVSHRFYSGDRLV